MFIKVDGNGQVVESSSEWEEGFLKKVVILWNI